MIGFQIRTLALVAITLLAYAAAPAVAQDAGQPQPKAQQPTLLDGPEPDDGRSRAAASRRANGPPQWIQPSPYFPKDALQPTLQREDPRRVEAKVGISDSATETAFLQVPAEQTDSVGEYDLNGVAIGTLNQIDPATVGILTSDAGGFPQDFWRGTERDRINTLLPALPVATPSPARNALLRRLLLSALPLPPVEVPESTSGPYYQELSEPVPPAKPHVDLLVARLRLLAAGGDLTGFLALYDEAPELVLDEATRREVADAFLLTGDLAHGCGLARDELRAAGDPFWLQRVALCDAVDANENGVSFALGILRETGDAPPLFVSLLDRVLLRARTADSGPPDQSSDSAEPVEPQNLPVASSLLIALAEATEAPYVIDDYAEASPLALLKLARNSRLEAQARAVVAVLGASRGVVSDDAFGAILIATDLEPVASETEFEGASFESIEDRFQSLSAQVIKRGDEDLGANMSPAERALILARAFKAAAFEPDEDLRIDAINAAWQGAVEADAQLSLAPALSELAGGVATADGRQGFAHMAGRLHLLAGRNEAALAWYQEMRSRAGFGDTEAAAALVNLWPLMVAGVGEQGGVPFSESILDLWRQQLVALPFDEQHRRAETLYGLLEALGYTVPYDAWEQLLAGDATAPGEGPSLAYVRQMQGAAEAGRMGEVVLLALSGLGRTGPESLDPAGVASVVGALRSVGLEEEARALALEALVSSGF